MSPLRVAAFTVFCLAGVPLYVGGAESRTAATCSLLRQIQTVSVKEVYTLSVECPPRTRLEQRGSQLVQHGADAMVLTSTQSDHQRKPLRDLLPGATYVRSGRTYQPTNILNIPQLPGEHVNFFFKCRELGGPKYCHIHINVWPAERLGPNACAAVGSQIRLEVHAKDETVSFGCGTHLNLLPEKRNLVYDRTLTTVDLATMLPSAAFTQEPGTSSYKLRVLALPLQRQIIYYLCAGENASTEAVKACTIQITVMPLGKDVSVDSSTLAAAASSDVVGAQGSSSFVSSTSLTPVLFPVIMENGYTPLSSLSLSRSPSVVADKENTAPTPSVPFPESSAIVTGTEISESSHSVTEKIESDFPHTVSRTEDFGSPPIVTKMEDSTFSPIVMGIEDFESSPIVKTGTNYFGSSPFVARMEAPELSLTVTETEDLRATPIEKKTEDREASYGVTRTTGWGRVSSLPSSPTPRIRYRSRGKRRTFKSAGVTGLPSSPFIAALVGVGLLHLR